MQSIGQTLKDLREQKKMGIHELSQRTKVGRTILKAIEEDDHRNMPGRTYVRGFIKSYLREVGADPKSILEQFDVQERLIDEAKKEELNQMLEKNKSFPVLKWILFLAIIPLIYVSTRYLINNNSSMKTTSNEKLVEKKEIKKKVEIIKVDKKQTKSSIPVYLEYSPILNQFYWELASPINLTRPLYFTNTKQEVEKKVETQINQPTHEFPFIQFTPIKKENYTLSTESVDLQTLDWTTYNKEFNVNLKIIASIDDSWMTFKSDNNPIKVLLLKKGETYNISANEVTIFMGNFFGSQVFFNKTLVESPGGGGVKNFVFPPNASTKYKTPLFVHHPTGKIYTGEEYEKLMQQSPLR